MPEAFLEYTIKYRPGKYYVAPSESSQGIPYYAVCSETGRPAAICPDANDARTICLALELIHAQVYGNRERVRDLMKLVDALAKPGKGALHG